MHPQETQLVRTTYTLAAPGDESPAVMPAADSVALHRWARQQRSRTIGDVIARALSALAASTGRALDVFATPSTKRNPRADVI